jgi:pantetheine-phosphate adenylyltransferase
MDIAQRAASLFDELIVAVYSHPRKPLLFSAEERLNLVTAVMSEYANVKTVVYSGLTVDLVKSLDAKVIVRGLRVISDFEMEYQMALTNRQLRMDVDTICLMTAQEYAFISASLVKDVFFAGGDVSQMVHPLVKKALVVKLKHVDHNDNSATTDKVL